jgi:hypothetical protein
VSPVLTAVLAVGAVIVVALLARASSRDEQTPRPVNDALPQDPDVRDVGDDGADDEDDWESLDVVAVTSDGFAIVPDAHAVRLVPPHEEGEAWKAGEKGRNRRGELALAMSWHNGDFTGARVVHGAADEGPWRFEAMGRDGEYTAFVFETREGADAALKVFESRGVVRSGRDEDGNPAPASAEQFEEARRVYLETEAALEMNDDEERS